MNNKPKRRKRKNKNRSIIVNTNRKDSNIESQVLNQFVCEECYHTNLIIEDDSAETPRYAEKKAICTTCNKYTKQICVKDKDITKAVLEMGFEKTKEQERAYQMIKKSNVRRK